MRFYLGTSQPGWLWLKDDRLVDVPLFVSVRRLSGHKRLKKATCKAWALDSGGFSELSMFGEWTIKPRRYIWEVRRYVEKIGRLDWCAIQDWMCEPEILRKTGLSVKDHQQRTIDSYFELKNLASDLPFIPILQGWKLDDYLRHIDQYMIRGVDLFSAPVVGVGTLCRRQSSLVGASIVESLYNEGLTSIHGFGVKKSGLGRFKRCLKSSDSLAWTVEARMNPPLPGHHHKHCSFCVDYALLWRDRLLESIGYYSIKSSPTIQRSLPF